MLYIGDPNLSAIIGSLAVKAITNDDEMKLHKISNTSLVKKLLNAIRKIKF